MSEPVTVYQYPPAGRLESLSPFCVKVQLALMHKQVPFRVVNLTRPDEVRRVNARGRMPAVDIAGERVVDSTEILEAIERAYPAPPLRPAEGPDRARARILEDWADEVLYFYVVYWRWFVEPPDPRRAFKFAPRVLRPLVAWFIRSTVAKRLHHQGLSLKPRARIEAEVREALASIDALALASPTDFLLGGEQPTWADIAVFAQVDGLKWEALPRAKALVEELPHLMRWYEAVDAATRGMRERHAADGDERP